MGLKQLLRPTYGRISARYYLDQFARRAGESAPPGARMLDAGAGHSPYRKYFSHCTYEAADVCERPEREYTHVGYVCSLTDIPVEDERFDLVLCTQVLEHVSEPQLVLNELNRVLKTGCRLWISAPLFFEEHEKPYDYFRYTQFGWRHMMGKAGFEIERLDWAGGYVGCVGYQLSLACHALPRRPADYGGGLVGWLAAGAAVVLRPAFSVLASVMAWLDVRHMYTGAGMCTDYCLVVKKVSAPAGEALGAQETGHAVG
jgi:SAM-dependent methyltransferase